MKQILHKIIFLIAISIACKQANAQYKMMGSIDGNGRPLYLVNPADVVSTEGRNNIAATLPESRPIPIYNPRLIASGRPETIALTATSEVWVSFVDEGAGYLNVLGYYTYPTDAPLNKAPNASKIHIIFPNASKGGFGGGMVVGDKVLLGTFPGNTSIGFVLLADGWDSDKNKVTDGRWSIFTDSRFNPEATAELRKHTVMLYDETIQKFVFGIEDIRRDGYGSDEDFNDLLFYATVNPMSNVKNLDSIPTLTKDGSISYSGNTGGLESKSLGDAVAKRIFQHAVNSTQGPIDYAQLPKVQSGAIRNGVNGLNANSALSLSDIMPTKMVDPGYMAYVSTASDITSITNAVEVRSVDFTINKECRAVAFATKTIGTIYDHTKPVCDRLKGAQLMGMENFSINNLNFVRYTLLQPTGNIEYAMSFSVGKKKGRNSFSFQSQWLNENYLVEDTLYNYQIWGAAPYYCVDMAIEIINKFTSIMPINTIAAAVALPKTYIVSGKRVGTNLQLTVNNTFSASNGYIQLEERLNENSTVINKRNLPISIATNGKSILNIPVSDSYETTIRLFVNNQLQDVVFMADGSWNVDYNQQTTVVKSFSISNDASIANLPVGDIPLFRNVQLSATSSGYVSVYKLLKGGGAELDLSGYKTIKFKATATGANLRITLVKNSISNWSEQYSYFLPLSVEGKEYSINLDDFKSATNQTLFYPNDLTSAIFAFEVGTGKSTNITASISNIVFTKQKAVAVSNTIEVKDVLLYPNPSKGRFVASFQAEKAMAMTIKMMDANTGRPMYVKQVQVVKGENKIAVELNQSINTNVYILTIEGEGAKYIPKKMMIQK